MNIHYNQHWLCLNKDLLKTHQTRSTCAPDISRSSDLLFAGAENNPSDAHLQTRWSQRRSIDKETTQKSHGDEQPKEAYTQINAPQGWKTIIYYTIISPQQLFIIFVIGKRLLSFPLSVFWDLLNYNLILRRDLQYRLKQIQHWRITERNNAAGVKGHIDVLNYRACVQINSWSREMLTN